MTAWDAAEAAMMVGLGGTMVDLGGGNMAIAVDGYLVAVDEIVDEWIVTYEGDEQQREWIGVGGDLTASADDVRAVMPLARAVRPY